MPTDFELAGKLFHQLNFVESQLECVNSLTSLCFTPRGSILLGDLQGKLQHLTLSGNDPIVVGETVINEGTRISDVATNLSGNVFASTSFGVDDVNIGATEESGQFGSTSILHTRDRSLCVSFLEDQRSKQCLLLIGGRRGIRVHDVESGGLFRNFEYKSTFTSLHSWSGCMLMAGTLDGEVVLWDIRKPQAVASFGKRQASSGKSIFSIDASARLLTLATADGSAEFYDISSKKLIAKKKIIDGTIGALGFSPKQKYLAVANEERLSLVNLNEFSLSPLPFPTKEVVKINKVTGLRWQPSAFQFATRSTDKILRVFSLQFENDLYTFQ